MINKSISEAVLEAALRTGGDFSELYMQDTEFNTVKMVDGAVDNASYERKAGAGVRVLKGTRSAYAYTANTSESALIAAAKAAASALNEAKEFEAKSVCVERIGGYEQKIPFSTIKNADRIALLRSGTAAKDPFKRSHSGCCGVYGLRPSHCGLQQRWRLCRGSPAANKADDSIGCNGKRRSANRL